MITPIETFVLSKYRIGINVRLQVEKYENKRRFDGTRQKKSLPQGDGRDLTTESIG